MWVFFAEPVPAAEVKPVSSLKRGFSRVTTPASPRGHLNGQLCVCVRSARRGYPSPLLYIDPAFTQGRSHNADRHGSLLDRYVNLRRDYQRVGRELAQLEDDLHYALNSVGQDDLRAGGWILRRDKEGRLQVEVDLG